MRAVVFTGNPHLEQTPWWRVLLDTPDLEAVLVCRKVESSTPADVLRRFRRNVRKHGPLFIPYRIGYVAVSVLKRFAPRPPEIPADPLRAVPVEEIEALNIHAPGVLDRVKAWRPDLGVS